MSGSVVAALARRDFALMRSYRLSFVSDVAWGVLNLLVYFFISKLVTTADVVVQDFGPGVAQRLGVDHEALSAGRPRLITCSLTGYGNHPDHRDRPGYDALVAARDRRAPATGLRSPARGQRQPEL